MAKNFLIESRHKSVFYFRRRVPKDLVAIARKTFIVKSLETTDRARANILSRALAAKTDTIFQQLRDMKSAQDGALAFDFTLELELHDTGVPKSIKVNAQPEESAAVEGAIRAALSSLPRPNSEQKESSPQGQHGVADAGISASELFEDFFREGIALKHWKNPDFTRKHDYEPIWKRFLPHVSELGLTLAAIKRYRAEILAEKVAVNTMIRNLSKIHSVIAHGIANHHLDAGLLMPLKLSRPARKANGNGKKHYLPFSSGELSALFLSDSYRQNSFKKPSQFWLPLVGLYTGARIEELAGLALTAFKIEDGFPAVMLSDVDTTDGGKNEHAPRLVPVHKTLIELGLLDYVEKLRSEGHARLFPDIGEAARDGFGKRATDDFIAYRRSVGVGKDKGERSQKVFHSFRSTLAVKFFQLGIDGDLSRRLTGHAAIDVHQGTYLAAAAIPMERATEAMNKVTFELDHPKFFDTPAYLKKRSRATQRKIVQS